MEYKSVRSNSEVYNRTTNNGIVDSAAGGVKWHAVFLI